MKTAALVIFVGLYILLLAFPKYRPLFVLGGAAAFVLLGILPLREAFAAIDWNILMMLAGTMGTVTLFIDSKMPARLADRLTAALPDVRWTLIALALFSGLVSAFIDNVATVLMVAPIGVAISKKLNISPVPAVLAIAVSSNLQGAATLVGDTTSILLGGYLNMDFADFFFMDGRAGMFWIVQAGALATIPVLYLLFRKETACILSGELTPVSDPVPTVLLAGTILSLIAASFLPEKPAVTNGVLCLAFFAAGLVRECIRRGSLSPAGKALRTVDYQTLLLLAGLFAVIAGISRAGIIDDIAGLFVRLGGGNLFATYTLVVWLSVLFSAFIDNIPYVAAMLPVMSRVAASLGTAPTVLCLGLLAGATLGGNLTPVGASANIAAGGILRREGYPVSVKEFMRIGVPFTMVAVVTGYLLIWLIYA